MPAAQAASPQVVRNCRRQFGSVAGSVFRRLCESGGARDNQSAIVEIVRSQPSVG